MTEEVKTADLPAETGEKIELTDEQVDKFFESKGEVDPQKNETAKPAEPKAEAKEPEIKEVKIEEEKPDERKVPLGALHEERAKRKELQRSLEQQSQAFQEFQKFVFKKLGGEQEAIAEPKFEEDPFAYLKHRQDRIEAEHIANREIEEENRKTSELITRYQQKGQEFQKTAPDFYDAFDFLMKSRISEYETLGYSRQEALQAFHQEELNIAKKSFADEANPAQRLYDIAKMRGYKVAEKAALGNSVPPLDQQPANNNNKLEMMKKGVKASSSVDNISGGKASDSDELSLAKLIDVIAAGGDGFDKLWSDFEKKAKGKKRNAF